jgi:hypothetical protein
MFLKFQVERNTEETLKDPTVGGRKEPHTVDRTVNFPEQLLIF